MRLIAILVLGTLLATTGSSFGEDKRTEPPDLGTMAGVEAQAFHVGVDAVIWGYPMVKFEDLMRGRTLPDAEEQTGNPRSQVNQLGLMRRLRGPEFKQIATPNNDTLYTQSFCDVSREPLVLSVPAVDDERYYCMQLWDPNGDTFGYVGTRATGREAGSYALVGPAWTGTLPAGIDRIDTPYNSFAIWGRIGVNGPQDLSNALAVQDQVRLVPLSRYGKSAQPPSPDVQFSQQRVAYSKPADLPDGLEFYFKLACALQHTPPKPVQDDVITQSLAAIGFSDDNTTFDCHSLNEAQQRGLTKAVQFGLHLMDVEAETSGTSINGWRWSPKSGILGTDYLFRAAWAKWFTGGNAPVEAIYMDGRTDNLGQPFEGRLRYKMRFEAGRQPPVSAFWSLSMYHLADGSFVENEIQRYSIGDRTPGLVTNDDGSLTIYIQHETPDRPEQRANWLPSPQGGFYLNLRLYVPNDGLPQGVWAPPQVTVD